MSIVVGYAPSAQGTAALRAGIREARSLKEDLVVAAYAYHDPERGKTVPTEEQVRAEVDQLAEGELPPMRVLSSTCDDAGEFLLEAAQKVSASLLVIGLRRKSPIGKLNLGAAARRVLLGAPCPVLAVKDAARSHAAA
ncbi:universal stress protein [Brachybacterium phenoliresistens]|uniref:Universal stress protein UspA n=1 Tax=Brachybacterium phenoliresistens TaxID=396014 RepID=Z9JY01_9MICO|nr:universal stress protein [Brachybacterium phenoliresistens]EWS82888.1 universal stress protein UspA [Brachybacterium phenoliresistens]